MIFPLFPFLVTNCVILVLFSHTLFFFFFVLCIYNGLFSTIYILVLQLHDRFWTSVVSALLDKFSISVVWLPLLVWQGWIRIVKILTVLKWEFGQSDSSVKHKLRHSEIARHTGTNTHANARTRTHTHTHTHAHTQTQTHTHTYQQTQAHTNRPTHAHTYTHSHTHTHTHLILQNVFPRSIFSGQLDLWLREGLFCCKYKFTINRWHFQTVDFCFKFCLFGF